MGRFYETSTPNFVDDKMFELPYEMMYKGIQVKDKAINDEITHELSFLDSLKANVWETDSQRANQIIAEKTQAINDMVSGLQADPGNLGKYKAQARKLSQDINSTFLQPTGEITLMEKNNAAITGQIKTLREKHKDDPAYAEAVVKELKDSYAQGLAYDTAKREGKYSPAIRETFGLDFKIDDFIKAKLTADEWSQEKDTRGGDGYIYRNKKTGEALDENKIANAFTSYMQAQPNIQNAVADRTRLGLQGFENADLNTAAKFDEKGNVIAISDDYYGRNLKAAIQNMKYSNTSKSDTISTDQPWLTRAGWARDDAAKAKEEEPDKVGWSYYSVSNVDSNSAQTYSTALTQTNLSLLDNRKRILAASGMSPDTEAGKQVMAGNSHYVEAAIAKARKLGNTATADALESEYNSNNRRKTLLNAQAEGFENFAKSKGVSVNRKDTGWIAKNKDLYNQYLAVNSAQGKNNNPMVRVGFENTPIDKKTITELQGKIEQMGDKLSFNVDNTVAGSFLEFEDTKGNKTIYVPRGYKYKDKIPVTEKGYTLNITEKNSKGVVDPSKSRTVTYRTAPGGQLTNQLLVQQGLLRPLVGEKDDKTNTVRYVTRQNGKDVGFIIDNKSIGLSNTLDEDGNTNYGVTAQIGNTKTPLTFSTSQIQIEGIDNYLSNPDVRKDMEFTRDVAKTNFKTLAPLYAPGPSGSKYFIKNGKTGVITAKGEEVYTENSEQEREIMKIVLNQKK